MSKPVAVVSALYRFQLMTFFVQLTAEGSPLALESNPVPPWLQYGEALGQTFGALATAIGVLIALGVAVWWEPRKAREERSERSSQAIEEAKRHREQLAELRRAENDRLAAQARRITVAIRKADILVERIWHVGIKNTSSDAISGLRVRVTARDGSGTIVEDGCRRAQPEDKGRVADATATVIVDAQRTMLARMREQFDEFYRHVAETYGTVGGDAQHLLETYMDGMGPFTLDEASASALKEQVKEGITLEIGEDWPSRLAPGESATVAYQTDQADYTIETDVYFTDGSAYLWHRDETKLERINEPESEPESEVAMETTRKRGWWNPLRWSGH